MQSRGLMWLFVAIGSTVGGYIPTLWGAGFLSFSSMLLSAIGAFVGIWAAYRISQ